MAEEALENVEDNMIIGLGSGFAVSRFVDALSRYIKKNKIKVLVIPSSLQIQIFAERAGLEIAQPNLIPLIDLVVDGLDQIDKSFNMIKGGGGALLREKVLMRASKKVVILANEDKFVEILNRKVPIEVLPFARNFVSKELEKIGGKPELRVLKKGYPLFTENGNIILDTDFGLIKDPPFLLSKIKEIPGVVEAGIFTERINIVYKGCKDGTVKKITPK
ncbi:MAG: ribose-5-phosphate isomerase RpiA [archaeon]|nr:ribose-5-phosphate isomerase RpiA [archaeon]